MFNLALCNSMQPGCINGWLSALLHDFDVVELCPLICTVREVTSTLSEIRWQLLGRRKSMSETPAKPRSLPTVFCFSTTSLGKTYCRTVDGNPDVIWQQAALASTWQATRYFSCLLWEYVIPRFCKKPTCCILSCSKFYNHADASNSHASLGTVKTK